MGNLIKYSINNYFCLFSADERAKMFGDNSDNTETALSSFVGKFFTGQGQGQV